MKLSILFAFFVLCVALPFIYAESGWYLVERRTLLCDILWLDFWFNSVAKEDICKKSEKEGEFNRWCDIATTRYTYDSSTGKCRSFADAGCNRSENNFETEEECLKTCGGKWKKAIDPIANAASILFSKWKKLFFYIYDVNKSWKISQYNIVFLQISPAHKCIDPSYNPFRGCLSLDGHYASFFIFKTESEIAYVAVERSQIEKRPRVHLTSTMLYYKRNKIRFLLNFSVHIQDVIGNCSSEKSNLRSSWF